MTCPEIRVCLELGVPMDSPKDVKRISTFHNQSTPILLGLEFSLLVGISLLCASCWFSVFSGFVLLKSFHPS